jgi:hypothetical protein
MKVLVECYHDTALVRALGVPIRQIGHGQGKGDVLTRLAKQDGSAVGMIDKDPGKQNSNPRELAKYRSEEITAQGLQRLVHRSDQRKTLILVNPTLEHWLLSRANVQRIQPREYGLPEDARSMHKSPRYDQKPGFHRFLQDLTASDDGMKLLRKWLADR